MLTLPEYLSSSSDILGVRVSQVLVLLCSGLWIIVFFMSSNNMSSCFSSVLYCPLRWPLKCFIHSICIYFRLLVSSTNSISHYALAVSWQQRRVPLVEQELLTRPEHLISPSGSVFSIYSFCLLLWSRQTFRTLKTFNIVQTISCIT